MRIALLGDRFSQWGGGRDFLLSCANALNIINQTEPLQIYLLLPRKGILLEETEIEHFRDWFRNISRNIQGIPYDNSQQGLIDSLHIINADVVFPVMESLGKDFPVPWIGYWYDFQHKYYPEYFSADEYRLRDWEITRLLSEAKAILVAARTVKEDALKFFPEASCQIFVLPPAPGPIIGYLGEEQDVHKKYSIPEKYFLISNQFWVHKSHITAFEALSILKQKTDVNISIVCTGKTFDPRFPTYFSELEEKIKSMGIKDRVYILGHIPKQDQIQIMYDAIAVLQPSLFEGTPGGGSVREAVSLGIPSIISDIPVNKELTDKEVIFFRTGSVEDLAEKMVRVIPRALITPPETTILEAKAKARAQVRGEKLLEVISYVKMSRR
ncbi:MAG: glycosyl transferase group 1 [Firmicutes bacterium]|nr:glycosyl transferase group 1 [Bacillota bacterium]